MRFLAWGRKEQKRLSEWQPSWVKFIDSESSEEKRDTDEMRFARFLDLVMSESDPDHAQKSAKVPNPEESPFHRREDQKTRQELIDQGYAFINVVGGGEKPIIRAVVNGIDYSVLPLLTQEQLDAVVLYDAHECAKIPVGFQDIARNMFDFLYRPEWFSKEKVEEKSAHIRKSRFPEFSVSRGVGKVNIHCPFLRCSHHFSENIDRTYYHPQLKLIRLNSITAHLAQHGLSERGCSNHSVDQQYLTISQYYELFMLSAPYYGAQQHLSIFDVDMHDLESVLQPQPMDIISP